MRRKDAKLDELLAGGTLGGPAYDEILARVLERTAPSSRPAWRQRLRWLLPGAVLVPAAAAWLLFIRPHVSEPTPKGGLGQAAIEIGCGEAGAHLCHSGDTLMFSVNAAVAPGHVAAYAERLDDPARERIWYFPTATGAAPMVARGSGTIVLPDGVRLGPEHVPGHYRVTAWISDEPVARADADRGTSERKATIDLEIVP